MAYTPWFAGQTITAERLNGITPIWTPWTPVWTTSTGANLPSYGSATVNASYCVTGNMCNFRFEIIFAADTTFGAGDNWRFGLPLVSASVIPEIGFAELNQSLGRRVVSRIRGTVTTHFELETSSGAPDGAAVTGGIADATAPWAWVSGDAVRGTGMYEIA